MTMSRVLVAVDDSPAALSAARAAVELACLVPESAVRFVHVLADGEVARRFSALQLDGTLRRRRVEASASLLEHVLALATAARVTADTAYLEGEPASALLGEAASWHADLIVLGRDARPRPGHAYVGATARHVLEFSEIPVLQVPERGRAGR